jgi:succinate dehydrogenase / fumarate reductase, cytochrome b subunit
MPAAIYLLGMSLQGEEGFARARAVAALPSVKLAAGVLAWALAHHLLAGVRHMLSDLNIGSPLIVARKTAYLVNFGALVMAALAARLLW